MLKVEGLTKHYGAGERLVKAVDQVSFQVEKGEFISISGKSGSGKSTLLHLIGGLEHADSGRVVIDENEIGVLDDEARSVFRRRNIGFVFQSYNLLPTLNVRDNIVLPLGLDGKKADVDFFHEVISILEIADKLDNFPNSLSGGEQQRVAIARALLSKPALILADEPTGNLDSETSRNVVQLIEKTGRYFGQTMIMVTHDEELARRADRMIYIEKGKIARIALCQ